MKRRVTREDIIRTTRDLIIRDGIRAVRVDEIAQTLGISKRTLQTYRNSGILPYSQTGHKIIYRSDDVKQVFERYMIEK